MLQKTSIVMHLYVLFCESFVYKSKFDGINNSDSLNASISNNLNFHTYNGNFIYCMIVYTEKQLKDIKILS